MLIAKSMSLPMSISKPYKVLIARVFLGTRNICTSLNTSRLAKDYVPEYTLIKENAYSSPGMDHGSYNSKSKEPMAKFLDIRVDNDCAHCRVISESQRKTEKDLHTLESSRNVRKARRCVEGIPTALEQYLID